MNQLIIAAFPEAALNIIVADAEDNEIARSLAFEPDMVPALVELLENYGTFDMCTIYGPRAYIEGIEKKIEAEFDTAEIAEISLVSPGKEFE